MSGSRELAATGTQMLTAAAGGTESGRHRLHDGDEVDPAGLTLPGPGVTLRSTWRT